MCKKTTFDTWWDASQRLFEIKESSDREEIPQRYYKCEICNKWHLTKISVNDKNERNKKIDERTTKRQENFINREANFYKKKFNLE